MASIEKRGEGKWRVSEMRKGKRYRVIIESESKPGKRAAQAAIDEVIQKVSEAESQTKTKDLTIKEACDRYISAKENSLSPSTVSGYKSYKKNLPDYFSNMLIDDVTEELLQQLVKYLQDETSVKYAKNVVGFLKSVIKMFRKNTTFNVTFAVDDKEEPYIPTQEELKQILDAAKGTMFEIPLMLGAVCGLRRGEILALTVDDLDANNVLTINKVIVVDYEGKQILKNHPKTKGSIRKVYAPPEIADKIRQQGYVYKGAPTSINKWLIMKERKLGIKEFSLHKLRHYFCTSLHENGVPEADILKLGGWSDPSVMKRVYRHGKNDLQTMSSAAAITANGLF